MLTSCFTNSKPIPLDAPTTRIFLMMIVDAEANRKKKTVLFPGKKGERRYFLVR